jgi:hypothetical protein
MRRRSNAEENVEVPQPGMKMWRECLDVARPTRDAQAL